MSYLWADTQDAFIRANPWIDDEELLAGVNARGPKRSWGAVRERRWYLGFRRPTSAVDRSKGGRKSRLSAAGWPKLAGTEEERHERYCALVVSEFARLHPELVKVAA